MNKKYILRIFAIVPVFLFAACNSFLDENPDNRTEIDSPEKITKLLVSAYPTNNYTFFTEMMSDNTDNLGPGSNSYGRSQEQFYQWADITETPNDGPKAVWEDAYNAIASANQALLSLEELGNPSSLSAQRGEALICRAFHHFVLVNLFGLQYNPTTSGTDLGIPYMEKAETEVAPHYERESVAEVYKKIEADIEAALPLIDDNIYVVPRYHFNRRAAYAFAARFNLYYQKYDKAIEYASVVLSGAPNTYLRDARAFAEMTRTFDVLSEYYISADHPENFLIHTGFTELGVVFGPWTTGKRYAHTPLIADNETTLSRGPWGSSSSALYLRPFTYRGTGFRFVTTPKVPYLFEMKDPVAQTGYAHSIFVAFRGDETLLTRAEAYIMKEDYENATADLALWQSNNTRATAALTRQKINDFYQAIPYYAPDQPTVKKKLDPPGFKILSQEQENFLHCLLHMRRIETIHEGLRWFDVKRFGIVIQRRLLDDNDNVTVEDELTTDDPRRAIQLPDDVISAGLQANPRN